ncbi:MAG: MFS transporter [Spirochaetales bacterium]|nr:MFS transporter [Spirochaetales bacterium]
MKNLSSDSSQKIPGREITAFSAALGGQNILYGLQVAFIMYAFTEFLGLKPAAVGILFIAARVWDAFNDPIMGLIADRTRTRWGKFRPWLLVIPIPIAILTILNFVNPGLGSTGNLIYASIIYILWGMVYTLCDIPIWALTSAMSRDSDQRTKLISIARIVSMVGLILPTILVPAIADAVSPNNQYKGYLIAVIILCSVGGPLMILAFLGTTERTNISPDRLSFKKTLHLLKINKPMQLLILTAVLYSLVMVSQAAQIYFAAYNLGSDNKVTIIAGLTLFGMMLGMGFTPLLAKKIGKRKTVIYTGIIRAVIGVIFFMIGYGNEIVIYCFVFIFGVFLGPFVALQNAMIGDTVDYAEYITGERAEGITFSLQTFANKIESAFSGGMVGIILTLVHFVPPIENQVQEQTEATLNGIFAMISIIPAIGSLIMIIPMIFYPLSEAKHAQIVAELENKRNNGGNNV